MSDAVDEIKRDRAALGAVIESLGLTVKGKNVQCPWHDDQCPSASILEGTDGHWRIWCHVCNKGGDVFDLREKHTGLTVAEQLRAVSKKADKIDKTKKTVVHKTLTDLISSVSGVTAEYIYTHPETRNADMIVLRLLKGDGKKTFMQGGPVDDGFAFKAPPKPWPIYNRQRVSGAESVIVVEGEKDVHTLHGLGLVATTSPGGASNAASADWSMLAGKDVTLWPDNDEAGAGYMDTVRGILEKLEPAPRISRIDPAGLNLPPKGDVTDLVEALDAQTPEQIKALILGIIEDAQPAGASAESMRLLEDKISGKIKAVPWPWGQLTSLSRSLIPGTVTIICGGPGSGKSFLALEAAARWHRDGIKLSIYELEEDRAYHLDRAIAQTVRNAAITDPDWPAAHPDEARAAYVDNKDFLDSFGARIWEAPNEQATLKQLGDWVEKCAADGCRLIVVDPVSAAEASERPWADDLAFIMRVKTAVKKSGASLILVMHPKKGNRSKIIGLDDLAGGAAYQRFAQTVLWLERLPDVQQVQVDGSRRRASHLLKVLKTRNGPGAGSKLAYMFNGQTLGFSEVGVAERKRESDTCDDDKPRVSNGWNRMDSKPDDSEDLFA